MKILVIAPHGDDEVLGCGGTICKYVKEGHTVDLCIVSQPHIPNWSEEYIKNRETEIANVCNKLGISRVIGMGFSTTLLDTVPHPELNGQISEVIRTSEPDIVFIPFYGDIHKDHLTVYESCMVALRPTKYKTTKILMYETVSETEWGKSPFKPNIYIDISGHIYNKIEAMQCYKSELKTGPHPRSISGIMCLAGKRGSEINTRYAEAFMLVREIL